MLVKFLDTMRHLEKLRKSFIIGKMQPRFLFPREGVKRFIHIWWGGMQHNGDLMILLAYLLTQNPEWRDVKITILSMASTEEMRNSTETYLNKLILEIRIDAVIRVIMEEKGKTFQEIVHRESAEAEVVIFGLATPAVGKEEEYAKRLEQLTGDFPTVFFVKNSSLFMGQLLLRKSILLGGSEPDIGQS
ncbi:MAG: hypothetical protein A2Y62_03740 [Candidatus Fischerbacteria bacterium RBG_13_37_8]|uniref:SLC12A transporter C-terminal domain-containing protein n=1 Tax=Candidatus Fischerbacteria bacterium RBG_13_37_8 TaxID=1817863 RepID=A0A1F5V803_9BACT|nr:MAG: hypothetical protein A2Y62_03740 [Candidatus Fischerbacteria bacterium RBG_13_37_8]